MSANRALCAFAALFVFVAMFMLSVLGGGGAPAVAAASGGGYATEAVYLTVSGSSSVRINWPEYASSGYAYVVQVKEDEGGFEAVAELSRTITAYEYSGVRAQSVYVFRIMLRELRTGRDDAYYNEIIYKPSGAPLAPTTPSLVQVSPTETFISWVYAEGAAYETEIERRRDGEADFSGLALVPAGVNRYTDASVEPNTLYRYRIRARYGVAVYSPYVEASVRSAIETPQITSIYAASPSTVYVSWTASADASRYTLERKRKGDLEFSIVTSSARDRTYYTDSGVLPGERYYYRVKAVSQNGSESLYSDEAEVTAAYIDISQTISAVATGDYRVELSWSDLGDKESTYEIWRYDEQYSAWTLLDTTERNAVSYVDARVGPGERYVYRIRARSAVYDSVSQFSAETYTETVFINAPTGLRQTSARGTVVNLAWRDNSSNESAFYVERRSGLTGQWYRLATTGPNVTERTGLSATANTAWYFRVGAYSSEYRSVAYSEPMLADNGFEMSFRGSSYRTDGDAALSAGGSGGMAGGGGGSGSGSGASGSGVGELQLDSYVVGELARLGVVASDRGVVVGGGEPVTRGEFVAMLVRALSVGGAPVGSFGDVKQGHPFYAEIMQASRLGFVRAESGDLFFPDRIITRAEMIVFVFESLLAYGVPLPPHGVNALRPFPDRGDVPESIIAQTRAVFGERIMIGIGTGAGRVIGAERESTREQAALVIYRYIKWLDAHSA
ncbi:MAG: fibronectin type III domain-containing protein [Oscillospiraceae bacterium]|nr:fibronectin type III domain-containing protein [Oscillospiraceae bacterium]